MSGTGMRKYIINRLLVVPVTLLIASLFIFGVLRTIPGDPIAALFAEDSFFGGANERRLQMQMREEVGLAEPIHIQYYDWWANLLKGNFGQSFAYRKPAIDVLKDRLPPSFAIMGIGLVTGVVVGLPAGILSAVRRNSWLDYLVRGIVVAGLSMPSFVTAAVVMVGLIWAFKWLPPARFVPLHEDPVESLKTLLFPGLIVGYSMAAGLARVSRTQFLEVIREDYIRTAWAKGLRERAVVFRHALRNSLLPVITLLGVYVAQLIAGAVVVETMFNIPGLGQGLVRTVLFRDYAVIQLFVISVTLLVLGINLFVDLLYSWIDPRVRYE